MTTLHIVIIGASASPTTEGQTPDSVDVSTAIAIAESAQIPLRIHLIDPEYMNCRHPKDNRYLWEEHHRIVELMVLPEIDLFGGMYNKWNNSTGTDPCIFVSYEGSYSAYDVMSFIESTQTTDRWFHVPGCEGPRCNVTDLVTDYIAVLGGDSPTIMESPYNIYSGDALTAPMVGKSLDSAKERLSLGFSLLKQYITGEFHMPNTSIPVRSLPSWVYNVETPYLEGIISYYGMIPEVKDQTPAIEIRESADYRRRLTCLLCQVMANFAVRNKLVTISEVVGTGGWYSIPTWTLINDRLLRWTGQVPQ